MHCHGLRPGHDDHDAQPGSVTRVGAASYYREYRFGDIFCSLKRAPNALRARLAKISGVAAVETQVVGALRLHLVENDEIVHANHRFPP